MNTPVATSLDNLFTSVETIESTRIVYSFGMRNTSPKAFQKRSITVDSFLQHQNVKHALGKWILNTKRNDPKIKMDHLGHRTFVSADPEYMVELAIEHWNATLRDHELPRWLGHIDSIKPHTLSAYS